MKSQMKLIYTGFFKLYLSVSLYLVSLLVSLRLVSLFSLGSFFAIVLSVVIYTGILLIKGLIERRCGKHYISILAIFSGATCAYAMEFFIPCGKSIIWFIIFSVFTYIFNRVFADDGVQQDIITVASIFGTVFALFELCGYLLAQYNGFLPLQLYAALVQIVLNTVSLCLFFTVLLIMLFKATLNNQKDIIHECGLFRMRAWARIAVTAFAIFACWVIYYIAFYPGIMTIDSVVELTQQLGDAELSNHHPIIHQLFIKFGLILGGDSVTRGVGIQTLLQMIIMATIFSVCINYIASSGTKPILILLTFAFYALNPINAFYSITMWKDVLFGGFSILLMILLIKITDNENQNVLLISIATVATAFMFCTFRNNGYYAFVLGFPLYLLVNRKQWKKLAPIFVITVILVSGYKFVLFNVAEVKKSASGEALSVPLQQIARVVKYDGIDEEDENFAILREVFPNLEGLADLYVGDRSVAIKDEKVFLSDIFSSDKVRYATAWVKIGIKHPVTYIEAFMKQNYGYWYTDVDYWIVTAGDCPNEYGVYFDEEHSELRNALANFASDVTSRQPVSILASVGFIMWICAISVALIALKGYGDKASPMFIIAALWLTTLAGPIYCEFRYIYGIYTVMPILVVLAVSLPACHELSERDSSVK